MATLCDTSHDFLVRHSWTWDPHLCHLSIFDWSLDACVHLENGGIPAWMDKHFHDSLMRNFFYVHMHDIVVLFDDLYFVLMMFWNIIIR